MFQKLRETSYDLKASNSDQLRYCMQGVGGDGGCHLQVPLDGVRFLEIGNMEHYTQEMPHNCVRLQLARFPSVSKAVEAVRRARTAKWPVIVVSSDSTSVGAESSDTFLADFAVGAAAGQFLGGGVYAAECAAKYNRLLEIAEENPNIRFVGEKFRK